MGHLVVPAGLVFAPRQRHAAYIPATEVVDGCQSVLRWQARTHIRSIWGASEGGYKINVGGIHAQIAIVPTPAAFGVSAGWMLFRLSGEYGGLGIGGITDVPQSQCCHLVRTPAASRPCLASRQPPPVLSRTGLGGSPSPCASLFLHSSLAQLGRNTHCTGS